MVGQPANMRYEMCPTKLVSHAEQSQERERTEQMQRSMGWQSTMCDTRWTPATVATREQAACIAMLVMFGLNGLPGLWEAKTAKI